MKRFFNKLRPLMFLLPGLGVGLMLWGNGAARDVDGALFQMLPAMLVILGMGLCVLYGRIRVLLLLVGLYFYLTLLQGPLAFWQNNEFLRPGTPLVFHSLSIWLPIWFLVMGLWADRGRPMMDAAMRAAVLVTLIGPFLLLAFQDPNGMERLLSDTHFPSLDMGFSRLAQLPSWLFGLSLLLLGLHARRHRRPTVLAAVLVLCSILLSLPWIFHHPRLGTIVPVAGMIVLIAAVVQEAFDLAFRDDLTGLPGRRALNQALERLGGQYTLAMVDVDHFKKFNDTYGHDAGDDVLKLVASRLAKIGDGGRAFRYGGEEFTLLFDGMDARQALPAIEDVHESIEQAKMQLRDRSGRSADDVSGQQRRGQGGSGPVVKVTASIGVADQRAGRSPESVIKAADKALYAAKEGGRNCVRLHGQRSVAEITGSDHG